MNPDCTKADKAKLCAALLAAHNLAVGILGEIARSYSNADNSVVATLEQIKGVTDFHWHEVLPT